jgi:DNA-binding NarL/FixJ family response regulator
LECPVPNLVKTQATAIDAFIEDLDFNPRADDLTLRVRRGVMSARVKRADGRVYTATAILGSFRRIVSADPSNMSPAKRRKIVRELHKEGHRQTAIAEMLGVSQATVSLDLRR